VSNLTSIEKCNTVAGETNFTPVTDKLKPGLDMLVNGHISQGILTRIVCHVYQNTYGNHRLIYYSMMEMCPFTRYAREWTYLLRYFNEDRLPSSHLWKWAHARGYRGLIGTNRGQYKVSFSMGWKISWHKRLLSNIFFNSIS